MADQTVVSASAIWQAYFDKLTEDGTELDFTKTGEVYFVQANAGDDSNDGKSWDKAFLTMEYALKVCDAEISNSTRGYGRGWASRNKIYCKGSFDEDLVKLADKTDVIGVGTAGTHARLIGTQVPADNTYATRMINWEFRDDGASSTFTFAAGGFEFHNCVFKHMNLSETVALTIANPTNVLIKGCEFLNYNEVLYSNTAILLTCSGVVNNCKIIDNIIRGTKGIYITDDALHNHFGNLIKDNVIYATTQCIDDNTDDYDIVNNRMITETTMANGIDCNVKKAVGNIITGSDGSRAVPSTDQEY